MKIKLYSFYTHVRLLASLGNNSDIDKSYKLCSLVAYGEEDKNNIREHDNTVCCYVLQAKAKTTSRLTA